MEWVSGIFFFAKRFRSGLLIEKNQCKKITVMYNDSQPSRSDFHPVRHLIRKPRITRGWFYIKLLELLKVLKKVEMLGRNAGWKCLVKMLGGDAG